MVKDITFDNLLEEIRQIPDHRLPELYELVHGFRIRLPGCEETKQRIMKFAGAWEGMPDDAFSSFLTEVGQRRKQAFSGRRADGSRADRY